jgi:hypothetical protein
MKIVLFLISVAFATKYFSEDFSSGWEKRWVQSQHKSESERGQLVSDDAGGVKTATDARFYQYSSKFSPFSNVSPFFFLFVDSCCVKSVSQTMWCHVNVPMAHFSRFSPFFFFVSKKKKMTKRFFFPLSHACCFAEGKGSRVSV